MFNPDKKVETIDDWYEAVITDFHDRSVKLPFLATLVLNF